MTRPIRSVLVANRGEIARRVFRTARAMGLRCIAVYVDADADAGRRDGPTPEVIESMGDKLAAKRIAVEAGVPTLASSDDPASAGDVGFPLLRDRRGLGR